MSSQTSSPDLPIMVKVTMRGDTRRFKMSLKEVGPNVFENKLRELLAIPEYEKVVFERYSDSAGTFVTLDPENTPVYKQLFRAAKAKLKLRIKATIVTQQEDTTPLEILPSHPVPTLIGARFPFAIYCNNCSASIWDAHYHCSTCDGGDFDLCTACTNKEVHCDNLKHPLNKREFKDGRIVGTETFIRRSSRICNGCACGMDDSQAVTCEDCKDYDLCISCLRASQHGHDPGHQLVRAHENVHLSDHEAALLARGRNVRHEAICDNCDDNIRGIRHKCIDCPDYDFCNQCIGKASELHPRHRFVPIYKKEDIKPLARCNPEALAVHFGVYCDGPICGGLGHGSCIQGPRYKCAVCPDTDFCANCEASPLNKHNTTHPLIKLKTPIRSVHVQTRDSNNTTMGDVDPAPAEKEATTSNAATQVQTIADVKPTKEYAEVITEKKEPEPETKPKDSMPLVATYVQDLVADGSVFAPGQRFTQAWCMRNTGTTPWPAGVTVQFVGGDYMYLKSDEAQLNATTTTTEVASGEQVVFSVNLTATWPASKRYISYWRLSAPDGTKFGDNIWCQINVQEPAEETEVKSEKDNFSNESVGDSVRDVKKEFESAHEDMVHSQASSQMIFPRLPVESPVHSVEDLPSQKSGVSIPTSPAESHSTLALAEALDECSLGDDESFMTDEEYDVLDASDEEAFEECLRMSK